MSSTEPGVVSRPDPAMIAWSQSTAGIATDLDTDLDTGLAADEAARRLGEFGRNELTQEAARPAWRKLLDQFIDPLVVLLLVAILVSLLAWWFDGADETPIEAIVIAAIVIANAVLGFWQERKAERAVDALRDLTASHVRVVRGGRVESVASTELVRGDVVLFAEGDMVGADCRITDSASLQIAEAALTGESMPVAKSVEPVAVACELADRTNMAYNGTAVVRGRGRGVVVATAMDTEIGRIAALLDSATEERTPLQQQIAWLGRALGITVVVLAAVVVAAILIASPISGAADVIDALLVGVSLAVAAVPEGLPAILSVVLALGVQRMAAQQAIVKRLSSVETLGSASVICTDKTGTLTRNEMTIVKVVTPSVDGRCHRHRLRTGRRGPRERRTGARRPTTTRGRAGPRRRQPRQRRHAATRRGPLGGAAATRPRPPSSSPNESSGLTAGRTASASTASRRCRSPRNAS